MTKSKLRKEIKVYSEKYDITGIIRDYGIVTKLFFTYGGQDIVMGIKRNILVDEEYKELGKDIIDSYVANIASEGNGKKTRLHYWYVGEQEINGKDYIIGHGIITGHNKMQDSVDVNTAAVHAIHIDEANGELVLTTKDGTFYCPLEYCQFNKQDKYPDIIPDYEYIKEKYKDKIEYPEIEPGKVLLVLANFCEYYFHSLCYIPLDSDVRERISYYGYPHVGMVQDSYLIDTDNYEIDLRYFPHFQNIEFYREQTNSCPLYIENIGDTVIYVKAKIGTIKLNPGDRKEVVKENSEDDQPALPSGDLYPARIIE